jgi:hypothetical protein
MQTFTWITLSVYEETGMYGDIRRRRRESRFLPLSKSLAVAVPARDSILIAVFAAYGYAG